MPFGRRHRRPSPDDLPLPVDDLPPLPLRRRVLIGTLAVVVALLVVWLLMYRPGDAKRGKPFATQAQCPDGQGSGCVGGKSEVMLNLAPLQAAASR